MELFYITILLKVYSNGINLNVFFNNIVIRNMLMGMGASDRMRA